MKVAMLATLGCAVAQPGFGPPGPSDVTLDWDKLLDMSTDVVVTGQHIPLHIGHGRMRRVIPVDATLKGHIQLDLLAEKLKVIVSVTAPGKEGHASTELAVDGKTGIFSVRGAGEGSGPLGGSAEEKFCLWRKLPQQLMAKIPPGFILKQRLEQLEQRLQMMASFVPHSTSGDVVTYHSREPEDPHQLHRQAVLRIHPDGVPIELKVRQVCDEECQMYRGSPQLPSLDVKFSNWVTGAGDVEPFHCAAAPTDLSAHPEALHPVALVQLLATQFEQQPETQALAVQLSELSSMLAEEVQKGTQTTWLAVVPIAAAAGVGALLGGLFALALVKAFSSKPAYSEPLLQA